MDIFIVWLYINIFILIHVVVIKFEGEKKERVWTTRRFRTQDAIFSLSAIIVAIYKGNKIPNGLSL